MCKKELLLFNWLSSWDNEKYKDYGPLVTKDPENCSLQMCIELEL